MEAWFTSFWFWKRFEKHRKGSQRLGNTDLSSSDCPGDFISDHSCFQQHVYKPLRFGRETTWLHLKVTCLTILYSQVPSCFLNWEVEIRNILGAQTANAMAAKKIIQSQRGCKTKHMFLLQCFLSLPFADPGSYTLSSEMVGEFAWNALRVFTHISSFKFWKGMLFPFFFFFFF